MNKPSLSGAIAWLSLLCFVVVGSSCVNEEYDMSDLNMEVTLFEEGLALPLGSTDPIKVKDLLNGSSSDFLTLEEDGTYSIRYADSFDMSDDLPFFGHFSSMDGIKVFHNFGIRLKAAGVPGVGARAATVDGLVAEVSENERVDIYSGISLPVEVTEVGTIYLDNAYIDVALDANNLSSMVPTADVAVDLTVTVPEILRLEGNESGVVRISGELGSDGVLRAAGIKVEALDVNQSRTAVENGLSDEITIEGTVRVDGFPLDAAYYFDDEISLNVNVDLYGRDDEYGRINVTKYTCKADYKMNTIRQSFDMEDFAVAFGDDANLDFSHVDLSVGVLTNLGLHAVVDASLVPYYDGVPDESKAVEAVIGISPSESVNQVAETRYTFKEEDIKELIQAVPDRFEFRMDVRTDSGKFSVIEPAADYSLDADYSLYIPLEFGEDFEITYRVKASGVPDIVSSLLAGGNKVMLKGEVLNSLPLGLELKVNLLDQEGHVIPLAEDCGFQKIDPCAADGSASKTDLSMVIAVGEGVKAEDIVSLELELRANSAGLADVPVTDDANIQAVFQFVLPEGLTFDINDLDKD